MYRVLTVLGLEQEMKQLAELPVWGESTNFLIVSSVHDGRRALDLLRHEHYDLTITEINLPLLDGLQLIRHISREQLCPLVAVLSDTSNFQYVRECILHGAFDYLPKMPNAPVMRELLARAAARLKSQQKDFRQSASDQPHAQETEAILDCILHRDPVYQQIFREAADILYHQQAAYSVEADVQLRHLFYSIIGQLYEHYDWLQLYIDRSTVNRISALYISAQAHTFDSYLDNLNRLVTFIWNMLPPSADENIDRIIHYVLSHPEEDLKLRTVAERTYMNYSYLSKAFSARIGVSYTEFVGHARFHRACYLLLHTNTLVGEIASRLQYRDAYYFSTLFKKRSGQTPTEYRESQCIRQDYSML